MTAKWTLLFQYGLSRSWWGMYAGQPAWQYPLTCMHTSSFLWDFMISERCWAVAGSWSTVEQAKVLTSSMNCASDVLGELTGHARVYQLKFDIYQERGRLLGCIISFKGGSAVFGGRGHLQQVVVVRSWTSGLWSVSRVNLSPRTYSSRCSHAQVEATASFSMTA